MHECLIEVGTTSDGRHAIRLDRECWQCSGMGTIDEKPCDMCDGTGYGLTDEGDHLLAFIKRHVTHTT